MERNFFKYLKKKGVLSLASDKKIGLIGAISIVVGTVIGASIFILLGPIAKHTGPSLYLAYFVAFLPALFSSLYYAQLGAAIPNVGGSYHYCKRLLSPRLGYLVTIALILGGIGAIVMLSLGLAEYLQFFFPSLNIKWTAIAIILLLYIVNILGLRTAEIVQIIMTIWIIAALLVYGVPGLFAVDVNNLTPAFPNGFGSFMMGAALAVYSYVGYGILSEIGGQIKNPNKNLPLAIFISLGIIVVLYVLVSFVTVGVVHWETLSSSGASVAEAARKFLPSSIILFISIGAILATTTTINAIFMTIPGDFVALGEEGIFKKDLHTKTVNQTAYIPLSFITALSIIGVLSGYSVDYFATITIVGLLFNAIVLGLAAWQLPKKAENDYNKAPFKMKPAALKTSIVLGVGLNIVFVILALLDAPSILLIFIIWTVIGLLLHGKKIPKTA